MTDTKPRQTKAIELLANGWTVGQVAKHFNVSDRQVYRWKSDPEYTRLVREVQTETLARVTGRLLSMSEMAINALEDLLNDPNQKGAYIRRLVAVSILEQLTRFTETLNFEERLADLERRVGRV